MNLNDSRQLTDTSSEDPLVWMGSCHNITPIPASELSNFHTGQGVILLISCITAAILAFFDTIWI